MYSRLTSIVRFFPGALYHSVLVCPSPPFPCPRQQHVGRERGSCPTLESPGITSTYSTTPGPGVYSRKSVMMKEEGEAERRHSCWSCQRKRMVVKRPSAWTTVSTAVQTWTRNFNRLAKQAKQSASSPHPRGACSRPFVCHLWRSASACCLQSEQPTSNKQRKSS